MFLFDRRGGFWFYTKDIKITILEKIPLVTKQKNVVCFVILSLFANIILTSDIHMSDFFHKKYYIRFCLKLLILLTLVINKKKNKNKELKA